MCRVAVPDVVHDDGAQQPEWALFDGAFNSKNDEVTTGMNIQHMLKTSAAVSEFVPDFFSPPVVNEQSYVQQQATSPAYVPQQEQSDMLECLDAFSDPLPSAVAAVDEFTPSDVSMTPGPRRTFSAFMEECEGSNRFNNVKDHKPVVVKTEDVSDLAFDLPDIFDFGVPDEASIGRMELDNMPIGVEQEKDSCPSTPESSYESDRATSPKEMFNAKVIPQIKAFTPKPMDMSEEVGMILALPGDGDVVYRSDLAAPNAANEHGVKRSRFKGVRWYRRTGRWVVQLRDAGRRKHLGYFTNEILAGRAYAQAMKEITESKEGGVPTVTGAR